jgi:hypothetical protein
MVCLLADKGTGLSRAPRKEVRARAPDFAGNRAASLKSKSYVGRAVLVLVLEGNSWRISKQCSHPERLPAAAGLEVLSGRLMDGQNPELKLRA